MKNVLKVVAAILLVAVSHTTVACQSPMDAIAESHVRANVPDEKDFDSFLKRDLTAHFKELRKRDVAVEYELLRDGPTQSGTGFPKFYAWVRVKENGNLLEEGAVRVAAAQKKRFGITDYLPRAEIESSPERVYEVFPKPVGDKVRRLIGK